MTSFRITDDKDIQDYEAVMSRKDLTWQQKFQKLWKTRAEILKPKVRVRAHLKIMKDWKSSMKGLLK